VAVVGFGSVLVVSHQDSTPATPSTSIQQDGPGFGAGTGPGFGRSYFDQRATGGTVKVGP